MWIHVGTTTRWLLEESCIVVGTLSCMVVDTLSSMMFYVSYINFRFFILLASIMYSLICFNERQKGLVLYMFIMLYLDLP